MGRVKPPRFGQQQHRGQATRRGTDCALVREAKSSCEDRFRRVIHRCERTRLEVKHGTETTSEILVARLQPKASPRHEHSRRGSPRPRLHAKAPVGTSRFVPTPSAMSDVIKQKHPRAPLTEPPSLVPYAKRQPKPIPHGYVADGAAGLHPWIHARGQRRGRGQTRPNLRQSFK